MKRTRGGRTHIELCVFLCCFLVTFACVAQFLVFSQRVRYHPKEQQQNLVEVQRRDMGGQPEQSAKKKDAAAGAAAVTPSAKPSPAAPVAAATTKSKTSGVLSRAQAKIRARAKAQAEVRELERMLAKLMRENSQTPDQSTARFRTELYGRRISQIIRSVDQHGATPHRVNGSRLRPPEAPPSPLVAALADPLAGVKAALTGQGDSDIDVFQLNNSSSSVPSTDSNSSNASTTSATLSVVGRRKSRTTSEMLLLRRFRHLNESEIEEQLQALATASPIEPIEIFKSVGHLQVGTNEGREVFVDEEAVRQTGMSVCPKIPDGLVGSISEEVNLTQPLSINEVLENNTDVQEGGEWRPPDCVSRHRVAIIIPYRDRWAHLKVLLYHLVPMLKRQQIHFRIFVVEQFGNDTFNKGLIMNAAFREAIKIFDFQCVTFHDVDLVPEDDRNMYSCSEQPKHMSVAIDKFSYILPYEGLVGGVLSLQASHFQLVNGYSNMYWGWGAEDDDMTVRIMHRGLRVYRPPAKVARYKMVKHDQRKINAASIRMKLLRSAARRSKLEGLNNVKYKLVFTHTEKLFTHFMVDIGKK